MGRLALSSSASLVSLLLLALVDSNLPSPSLRCSILTFLFAGQARDMSRNPPPRRPVAVYRIRTR